MNSKHEQSSLVDITLAYKITALTPLFSTRLHVHTGPGNMIDNLELQEWYQDREGMRITLRWYLVTYLTPLTIVMFLYNSCL